MTAEMRTTGVDVVGEMPWGTHFCLFYERQADLLETMVSYNKAGLESGEFCLWVVAPPLTKEDATHALNRSVPDLDRYMGDHSIEIASARDWYLQDGTFDLKKVIAGWRETLLRASSGGHAGVRVSGDAGWLDKKYWKDFCEYEDSLNQLIAGQRLVVLCAYPLASCGGAEILDVVRTHQFAVTNRCGTWDVIETAGHKQAKAEIKRLNEDLEQRVVERTRQLAAINTELTREAFERQRAENQLARAFEEIKQLKDRLHDENVVLREQIDQVFMFEEIVGSSPALKTVLSSIVKVALTDSTVLITGETGTGKELIARAIHKRSDRASRAFIGVNCAAIPPSLIASELFGHEKGAFTGALQRRVGRFEAANGGTIFLDEIGDLPPETQISLLRVLQEREIERVGSAQPIRVDVRVIAATNSDLEASVADGMFREDLYYRLNVIPIHLPALRERAEDIPVLVDYLIERYAKRTGKKIRRIGKKTLELFQRYDWPGNIRELQNVVERAVILCEGETFSVDETWFKRESVRRSGSTVPLAPALVKHEREMIESALAEAHGQIGGASGAAARLGIPRQTLESRIKALGINKFRFKVL